MSKYHCARCQAFLEPVGRGIHRRAQPRTGNGATGYAYQFSNAEIAENRLAHWIIGHVAFVEQDIGRFDIAMYHVVLVRIVNGPADGREEIDDIGRGERFSEAG